MSRPLYVLRAERDAKAESFAEDFAAYTSIDREEIDERLDHILCCDERSGKAQWWFDDAIDELQRRYRGPLFQRFQDCLDAVKDVYDAERREVEELIACGGKFA
jgi:hypothetical protein